MHCHVRVPDTLVEHVAWPYRFRAIRTHCVFDGNADTLNTWGVNSPV